MQQLEWFVILEKSDQVCLLKKSLYGLKQLTRQRYKRFNSFMIDIGYIKSEYHSCVYHKKLCDGSYKLCVLTSLC